ncbi:ABC transporter substrate-binding protein [Youhaiella tibetensis]|uniref:ABC transporter substrate-binding protein n=1 Tax=Paradevosia tibetensis TaxID=1447062 RepID=A0A5B9DNU7_9HYPH|nr:ABC transporter substrate-binding protein [Youhaiella tibetensis]AKR55818.1 ABC transporter permease [Devosia sp. H5989]QEE20877.1 ABC transporter substrate-binding protein [Youhaiella tibetensis]GGF20250.1 ABC transporter substrate-binding protein [Youhaiella tibetensis]
MRFKFIMATAAAVLLSAAPALAVDVKLGVLNDRSGVYADLSGEGSVIAARMAVEDFKAGDKGINVEIVSADHQNKPDIASNIARQWYDQDGVDAIFDVPTSSAALAVSQVTREKNKVFVDSGAGSTDLTGAQCSPNTIHWTYDTYALANGTARTMLDQGKKSWFFITADYAFGQALERDTSAIVEGLGGSVLGSAKYPFPGSDFSSYLLQAQASGANVIGLANAGGDTVNTMKQAAEFGITQGGQSLAALLVFITDVNAMGLDTAQGLLVTSAFYWDKDDQTRAFSERFAKENGGKMPTMVQAGVYAGVLDYLKAVEATGGKDSKAVIDWMKANPTDDPLFGKGSIRADGRVLHDMYLYQVKAPSESSGPWDYYKLVATIPADQAFRPMDQGGCELVK